MEKYKLTGRLFLQDEESEGCASIRQTVTYSAGQFTQTVTI